MVPMPKAAAAAVDASVDPLSGLSGLSFFPRTIRASADAPVPADPKDLDSIHNIMKSLKELRSPEKLMSEAKKIVDGGADLLSNISSFAGKVSVSNDIAAKAKERPQERRQGLGLARKKASFSLKTSISHPPVNLEPTLDIDQLQDPDAFFDAYERNENAKKEIQKQLGVHKENIDLYKPLNNERPRRPGILGHRKSFDFKHRCSSTPSKNDDMLMPSQETVYEDIPSPPKDVSPEKLIDPDPDLDELEEVEMAESVKKTKSQVSDMLQELLSYNNDDLEEEGVLNFLQERLKVKPVDTEKLYCLTDLPDVGRTHILTSPGSSQKPGKSSTALDSMLKNFNKKPRTEQELVENPANPVSSPTPPRNPFGSISLLKQKILQPNPLRDPFWPDDNDLCVHPNSFPVHPKDKLLGQVDTPKELDMSNELESHVELAHTEPLISEMSSQKVMGDADSLLKQSRGENASMERESGSCRENASPSHLRDKLVGHLNVPRDLGMFCEMESDAEVNTTKHPFCELDTQEVVDNADDLPENFEDVNASIPNMVANSRRNEETDDIIGEAMNANDNEANPSVVDEEARDVASMRRQTDPEQPALHAAKQQTGKRIAGQKRIRDASKKRQTDTEQQELHAAKQQRGKRVAGQKPIRDASTRRQTDTEEQELHAAKQQRGNRVAGQKHIRDASTRRQTDTEQQELHAAKRQRGKKVAGVKRIGDAHHMKESLVDVSVSADSVEAGTAIGTVLRRSSRVRMRPLEYWKGERFLYQRDGDSVKLIGLICISPRKSDEKLKVKSYEELVDLASRL